MDQDGPIVIAGGSGFLGTGLAAHLESLGREVVILSRTPQPARGSVRYVPWDARSAGPWVSELEGAAGLVNLVGRSVDCIKTPDHCDEILRSRVEATRALGDAMGGLRRRPPVWVQMSTAHIYGDPPTVICHEDSPSGFGLAPTVGRAWEAAFDRAAPEGVRRVVLRTTFVVGRGGGALRRLVPLARFGLGGRVGSGRQGMSWIHERDMNRIFERSLFDASICGVYVATSPSPVSNADFMAALRRTLGVPLGLPAAAWMVRLAAPLLLRTDPELALYGRYCVPQRLVEHGFEFEFPELERALADLLSRHRR
ncbi:MAG: TIGR01777 family protein [Myxococcales bacterium]|nr:TIGR01777 family protein [Myxococcales bacterium]